MARHANTKNVTADAHLPSNTKNKQNCCKTTGPRTSYVLSSVFDLSKLLKIFKTRSKKRRGKPFSKCLSNFFQSFIVKCRLRNLLLN